ncbi:hypothetical protein fugu_012091 [Takifugu bimaculatus]|uniref:SH3 domain-containing protein n=1 Tax=Takifugu bimaculatus TaxID=433685 RepID=A0A4Z2C9E2_9TELE|nr:hypothetical protein fugu_012091 [Takifugu bimaculatus]
MADRAEMFSLSTFHSLSPPGCRPAHDISLEEFDDEDLSEITDDCGIGLNYDSDPYEKDSLILEKSDMHHPVCSFQDDFQEFEMIDDEDDDDEEEEEEEGDLDAPPSPSASPPPSPTSGTLKSRPTMLNLTSAVSQDCLNNNSSQSPKKGSWQDSLCNPASQGRLSPAHSCLEDGSHVTGHCPVSPISQVPGSQCKGTPPKQAGEGGNSQSPHRPLLCDMEGNRRERLEYAVNDSTSPSSDPGIADMNQKGYLTSDQDRDLSSPGSDSDIEGELEAAFTCGGPVVSNMISSISETELDLTSEDSSSGRSSHLTNSIEEASSPTSDQELDPDTDIKRSFYLPVGPGLMPDVDEYDGTSEGDSESESEDELSENSDSPWLLSNLVNRMISEGSYPISCPEDCFKRKSSVSDTISPSSDIGDVDGYNDDEQEKRTAPVESGREERECRTFRMEKMRPEERRTDADSPNETAVVNHCLYMSNPTNDSITPLNLELCANSSTYTSTVSENNLADKSSKNARRQEEEEEPNNDLMMLEGRKDLDSPSLNHPLSYPDRPLCEKDLRQPDPDDGLAYDSVKYTLVVDENTTLELVSLKRCTSVLSDDSELSTLCDEEPLRKRGEGFGADEEEIRPELLSSSEDSSPESDLPFSKKFLNVFVNSTTRSSSTESFGLFSCTIDGEERDQTHRAVYRFIPRHTDELELDVDDPLYVEEEEDDYWYRGYNMRTGERGIFPAFYAHEVIGHSKELMGMKRNPAWMETFSVQFLGSVEVPHHQGNGILCAAMQKIAISRKRTVHVRPPSLCELEISLQGVKLIMSLEDEYDILDEYDRCSHSFQMKNISFCWMPPEEQLLLWLHHQTSDAEQIRLSRVCIPGVHAACSRVCRTSLPGILPGTSRICLPHRGHLPGVRRDAVPTTFSPLPLVPAHHWPPEDAVSEVLNVNYPPNPGSSFLQYTRH